MNNRGIQVAVKVWLHACSSQQPWPGEIFLEESKFKVLMIAYRHWFLL